MKYRIIAYVLASLCLIGTTGCGEKNVTTNDTEATTVASVTDTEEETAEETTEETTEEITESETESADDFEIPELSDEIPEEAVTKVTISESVNDSDAQPLRIVYTDEHDNDLLTFLCKDGDETVVNKNIKYEYNSNGDYTYKYELGSLSLNESYYEYDEKNRLISIKFYEEGLLSWESESKYDKYDNLILDKYTYYDEQTGEILQISTTDYSDCDYDSRGNIITAREHNSDGSLHKTTEYTYDDNGNVLTEKWKYENIINDNDGTAIDSIYEETPVKGESKYEYDPISGKKIFEEEICYMLDDSVHSRQTTNLTFDSEGRVLRSEKITEKGDKTVNDTIIFDYEDII